MTTEFTSAHLLALLHEGFAALGHHVRAAEGGTVDQGDAVDAQPQRRYLVCRAAFTDRAAAVLKDANSEQDAEEAARRLLDHDRSRGTGRGPVPAADRHWDTDPRGYVHQEHAVTVRAEHDQRRAPA